MTDTKTTLTIAEIRKLFRKKHGTSARIARELKLSPVTVSLWLKGKTKSARIEEHARRVAIELLQQHEAEEKQNVA